MAEQQNEMPAWFDQERHVHNGRGVYERGTGLALAEDGLPFAGMIRAQRLAASGQKADPLGLVSEDLIAAEGRALKLVSDAANGAARKPTKEPRDAE